MSNLIFPSLMGLQYPVNKSPYFDTNIQKSKGGREVRAQEQSIPLWKWRMKWYMRQNRLQTAQTYDDYQRLLGFFAYHGGAFDSFLYQDPTDFQLVSSPFGTPDGVKTAFQIARRLGGLYDEPVTEFNGVTPTILVTDQFGVAQVQLNTSRTNFMLQSEALDNASWTKSAATISANATTAPDGTATADKLVENSGTSSHSAGQNTAGTTSSQQTITVYAKPAGRNWLCIQLGVLLAFFDVQNGAIGTVNGGLTGATITSMGTLGGGGWYKCVVTCTSMASGVAGLFTATGNGVSSYTGDGTSGLYLWGAQLENGATATPYLKTTTTTVTRTDITSITSAGLVTFGYAPASTQVISATVNFYFRCRFSEDYIDADNFAKDIWETGEVEIQSLKI
jgi:hypothetical protein